MHELYLWPFVDALKAGGGNIMCSYQRVNNSYACQNSKLINGILKDELGFEGFLVSDWNAQTSGMASAEAGLDMMMPTPSEFWGSHLVEAVKNGSLPVSRVDDMAIRSVSSQKMQWLLTISEFWQHGIKQVKIKIIQHSASVCQSISRSHIR